MSKYIITHGQTDELTHWEIKGMKWGVRRYQNKDGSRTAAGKRRYITDMTDRKKSRKDDPNDRKRRIDADIKEADDRVKFYGSKRAAKAAIKDEASYVKKQNRGKAIVDTLLYGTTTGAATTAGLLAAGVASGGAVVLGAVPLAVAAGINATRATKANNVVRKHANDQISYTNESEYGHDIVVTMKKR